MVHKRRILLDYVCSLDEEKNIFVDSIIQRVKMSPSDFKTITKRKKITIL